MAKNRAALVDELEKSPVDSAALSACQERIDVEKEMQKIAKKLGMKNCYGSCGMMMGNGCGGSGCGGGMRGCGR